MAERTSNRSVGDEPGTPVYPVGLIVAGRRCLVVGGGRTAGRKVAGLVEAGADVHVIAPTVTGSIDRTAAVVHRRAFRPGDCIGYRLVFTATEDAELDAAVAADAEAAGAWVNASDRPEHCSVQLPAVLRRGPITVTVSTGGASPSLAGWLRDRIAELVTDRHAEVARLLAGERAAIHAAGATTEGIDWHQRIVELVDEVEVRSRLLHPPATGGPTPDPVERAAATAHDDEGAPTR